MKVEFRQGDVLEDKWEWILHHNTGMYRGYVFFDSETEAEDDWEKFVRSVANAERITKRSLK